MKRRQQKGSLVLWTAVLLFALVSVTWRTSAMNEERVDSDLLPKAAPLPPVSLAAYPLTQEKRATLASPARLARRKAALQQVRLRLFADVKLHVLTVEASGGLLIIPKHKRPRGLVTLVADRGKVLVRYERKTLLRAARVRILSQRDGLIELHRPRARGRQTNGQIIVSVKKGELEVVNWIDLESYVMGTVEPELGSLDVPTEAMKAQLIASRSYTLALEDRHPRQDFDFCDTPHCQVFAGVVHYPRRFSEAAHATQGLYLTYKGNPAAAFYHHSCGGQTAAIEDIWPGRPIPYLRRVKDGSEKGAYCRIGSRQEWVFTATNRQLRQCFAKQGWIRGAEALDALRVIRTNASGRVAQVLVQSSQPRWVRADQFRHAVNHAFGREVLLSTWFTISHTGDRFEFHGRGWGHGVGMCQSGSIYLARHGSTYREILEHYFPGTQLSQLPPMKKVHRKRDSRLIAYIRSWWE